MFGKKLHADVKKSTHKIQDVKKESPTRFKHLRIVLENVDTEEAKVFFEANFSHVYNIFYDNFIIAENNIKQKVHKAHREDLEAVLLALDKLLTLCPELLSRRWQVHSLGRVLTKLLHPANSWKLRREAIRFFLLWYQVLGENSPDNVHAMFATLVPGFPSPRDLPDHLGLTGLSALPASTVFHDSAHGPISPAELLPVFPPQSGEKQPEDPTKFFLDALLEFMVTQVARVEWKDKLYKQHKCFMFLFERFKMYYLPHMFPTFSHSTSLYKPVLDLALLRRRISSEERRRVEPYINCRVAFIKWIANFTHNSKKDQPSTLFGRSASVTPSESEGEKSPSSELRRVSVGANMSATPSTLSTTTSADDSYLTHFMPYHDHFSSEDPNVTAMDIVRDVLYGTRDNVNMIHEVYRQAFLLNFTYSPAIRRAVSVYKDWIQMNVPELPPFMLEPLDSHRESGPSSSEYNSIETPEEIVKQTRLRNDSYIGAVHKENFFVRAGLQNVLQVFITHAANVFLLEISHEFPVLLEEQVDTCKRVLNIYRYMVMHTHMEAKTWEQLLLVLLQITSLILSKTPPKRKEDTLGGKLAPAIFQTLIVTWIKANLNVVISADLWDEFLAVLSSLTQWEELIREWAKTLDTLTRVLARHVYNVDLNDLPLDRLSEQKIKRQKKTVPSQRGSLPDQIRETGHAHDPKTNIDSATGPVVTLKSCESCPLLRRSASESTLSWARRKRSFRRNHPQPSNTIHIPVLSSGLEEDVARIISGVKPRQRVNGRSRSMDYIANLTGDGSVFFERELSRSPSPAPSSGVESNSFKESPMQIDVLSSEGNNSDVLDGERLSVMSGGTVRGWLPDVAVVLWRRMLGALGNVNAISDPALHSQVFQYLVDLVETLTKIKMNQGVPGDNQTTPDLPELVPPITLVAPWCFEALSLPERYHRGKLLAYRLLCNTLLASHNTPVPSGFLPMFYKVVHTALTSNEQSTMNTIVRYCGPRLFSLQPPGFSLLLLDFIHAANAVVSSSDYRTTPRTEAISILGSLLSFPPLFFCLPVLQPTAKEIIARPSQDAKEHVVKILLRSGKREVAGVARCIALSSLGIFVYQQLSQLSHPPPCPLPHPKIKEAINTLLLALRFNHKTVAQVSSDILLLLADYSQILLKHFPEIPSRIVEVLACTLSHLMPVGDSDKRLLTSLVFCLGEWTMCLPSNTLLATKHNSCLLHTIFKVLSELAAGSGRGGPVVGGSFHPDLVQEFSPDIQLDNLRPEEAWRKMHVHAPSHINSPAHSVLLAARMVIIHLLNHLGHFPLAIGAARLCSLVVEQDDVPGLAADTLSAQVFSAPNIQLLMLRPSLLMSMVELPTLEVPGGGVTAGLVTACSQVRLILRDLGGKASWDASILYSTPEQLKHSDTGLNTERWSEYRMQEEVMLNSCIVGPSVPQHTLRHRPPNVLATFDNSADDLDNLDDILQYISHTSPECLEDLETPRNVPAPSRNAVLEREAMGAIVGQRFAELDYVARTTNLAIMQSERCRRVVGQQPLSPFHNCRLLFSQLGLTGWELRSQLQLLDKSEKLLRELRNLDTQRCRETHKIAVIYIAPGQEDKNAILSNSGGSQAYEDFISSLAWEVELESHTGFMGGLQRNKTTGSTAPYYATSFTEVIFHVSTRMPSSNHEALLQKTRHLGNDEVHIVWSEHSRDYRRGIIPTEFCDVLIVIYPLAHCLYRIQVSRKSDVPYFGPLFNEAVITEPLLAGLVRATAVSASRAKRSVIPFHQQYYEERARSLETVMNNHKKSSTFEEFAAQVFAPIQTPSQFVPSSFQDSGAITHSEELHIPSANSSNLAAALIDTHPQTSDYTRTKGSEGVKVWFSGGDGDHTHQHGISPRPLKKFVSKGGLKRSPLTPPDSPTSRRSK